MGRNAKPRKAYRPKGATIDAVDYTIALACKLGQPQRASLRNPLRAALNNLRTGRDATQAWLELADGMNVAEQLARRGYGIEISPRYCDVAIRRWQAKTGQQAVRQDGVRFDQLAKSDN